MEELFFVCRHGKGHQYSQDHLRLLLLLEQNFIRHNTLVLRMTPKSNNAQVFEHNVSNPNPSDGLIANLPDPRHKWNWQEKSRAKLKGLNINKIGKKKKESMKNVTL